MHHGYGGPRALQRLIDAAHRVGLAVILDVIHNHLGPEGYYLAALGPISPIAIAPRGARRSTTTGQRAMQCGSSSSTTPARGLRDFHADGLRLDAVQTIYDFNPRHILAEIEVAVRQEAARAGRLCMFSRKPIRTMSA